MVSLVVLATKIARKSMRVREMDRQQREGAFGALLGERGA
jgi:hypothetical protein